MHVAYFGVLRLANFGDSPKHLFIQSCPDMPLVADIYRHASRYGYNARLTVTGGLELATAGELEVSCRDRHSSLGAPMTYERVLCVGPVDVWAALVAAVGHRCTLRFDLSWQPVKPAPRPESKSPSSWDSGQIRHVGSRDHRSPNASPNYF